MFVPAGPESRSPIQSRPDSPGAYTRQVVLDGRDGERLSAVLAEPATRASATLVALHGAGMTSRYFTEHQLAAASFVDVATSHGVAVLCIDRPGYGMSRCATDNRGYALGAQVDILAGVISRFVDRSDVGAGLGLLGHSFGGKVALGLAANEELAGSLVSVDVSGCGHRLARKPDDPGALVGNNWGPLRLYPPGTFQASKGVVVDVPRAEMAAALSWAETFPGLAPRVRVPVRMTFAEHEKWWCHRPNDLADLREYFVHAPRMIIDEQLSAGHNIGLGWTARAYHLSVLDFFEESLLWSTQGVMNFSGAV